jgi:AcrR family transcriptional regulator
MLAMAAGRKLDELAAGPVGRLINTAWRVRPRQTRALETVERLLAAGEAIVRSTQRLDGLTLETVALEAGVTVQAAYRYFREIDDLILLAIRRAQAVEYERLIAEMTATVFETEAELAHAAAAFITRSYQRLVAIPVCMRDRVVCDYIGLSCEALWIAAWRFTRSWRIDVTCALRSAPRVSPAGSPPSSRSQNRCCCATRSCFTTRLATTCWRESFSARCAAVGSAPAPRAARMFADSAPRRRPRRLGDQNK